jgi:hypothetical protein
VTAHTQQYGFDVETGGAPALLHGPLHLGDGMVLQQLQDADVVLDAAAGTVLPFQGCTQVAEESRQLPAAENVGVVQRRRPALEGRQIMLGIEDLLVLVVAARVRGDHLAAEHDVDARDIELDGDGLESGRARHAVAIVVAAYHLVLVNLGRLHDAGIEGVVRQ